MPPKGHQPHTKPQNRVRPTQRSVEAKQFSTVRMPRSNEVNVNANAIHDQEVYSGAPVANSSSGAFDPISNDGMFTVITESKYWPPMPLEQLLERAPPELLGKVRVDDDKPAYAGSDSDSDGDDDNLNKAASSDEDEDDDDNANKGKASTSPAEVAATARSAAVTKAERIKQILNSDGAMDLYDRRDDEAKARKMLAKARKIAGELNHPRGKAPVNSKKTFDDDSD